MSPNILIRTLPLRNGNYGGILQAYAMQRVLANLGYSSVIDVSHSLDQRGARPRAATSRVKEIALRLGYNRPAWFRGVVRAGGDAALQRFAAEHLDTVHLYQSPGQIDPAVLASVDGFLAGSDQVWRREYGDVTSYLFDFLSDDDRRPRLSYAASFGHDTLTGYDPALVTESGRLARRMDALSVREQTAVRLVQEEWRVSAAHHVDPTMLLAVEEYQSLAEHANDPQPRDILLDYVLDDEPATQAIVAKVASSLGERPVSMMPPTPANYREYHRDPSRYRKASIESWLGAIGNARFVITDSFHGTVFAILNNVPFVAVVNRGRGAARFESLLDMFGLRDRLIDPAAAGGEGFTDAIDWGAVNTRIAAERSRSFEFLRRALAPADGRREV